MSKARTEAELTAQLTDDRNWRIREISDLVSLTENADAVARQVLLRALVAICYAHWEGGVKFSASKYMEFISLRKMSYDSLNPQFRRNYFLPRLSTIAQSGISLSERCRLIDDIISSGNKRFSRINCELIDTKSNLNYKVFGELCEVCGVDLSPFSDKTTFIDVVLLKRRNAIAHGEETLIDIADLSNISNGTINLIRSFSDALENQIYLGGFRA
ncbi:hypothetical protein SH203_00503 [Brevundimonas sp. SH203]|uniref:MAE_28990/MAE_18760 family HEPN-like nuclease n=1 Tax=Brevundimonas sp. SH203 TaxID=345167 RepID=UPI0009C66BA9|nr:MAE_28990/MAE_18760 family HEPN-like nuclease [Brevundimonas sp. SH203]GAW40109.1 hypothetical protein SH203_00503 [Brevundimonas sp. SH203]